MSNTYRLMTLAILALLSNIAFAETYTYKGVPFTTTFGAAYTTAMSITGSFTTASPLPANMPLTAIGPGGSNLVTRWSFNDGVNTLNNGNSELLLQDPGFFSVATDAAGKITDHVIGLASPPAPHGIGDPLNQIYIVGTPTSGISEGVSGVPCTSVTADVCTGVSPTASTDIGYVFAAGTWTGGSVPIPIMSSYGLAVTIFGLLLLAARRLTASRSCSKLM